MKNRNCLLFVFDGFSDWEPSLAMCGLNRFTDFSVKTFSVGMNTVKSFGNITVLPDLALEEVNIQDFELLILPGGEAWDDRKNSEIKPLIDRVLNSDKTLAAICGATSFLAQRGYLNNRPHTSNNLDHYLKKTAPDYKGEDYYVKDFCVTDGNLITANGTAMVEFAEAIFKKFDLQDQPELSFWFNFFLNRSMTLQ